MEPSPTPGASGPPEPQPPPRPRRSFSDQFKADAVALALTTGRPISQIAAELGIGESNLSNWLAKHRASTTPTDVRVTELEAELAKVRSERDVAVRERELLKRTVAFWVKESPS
jgi:transposase